MKYKCTQDLYLEKYDADGSIIENNYFRVPKDSVWEEDNQSYNIIGGRESVHLNRVWKSKKATTLQWIEIDRSTLIAYFRPWSLER